MTREESWVAFASQALGQAMAGTDSPEWLNRRARLAAKWADAMVEEWSKRFVEIPAEPVRLPRKRA